MIITLLRKPLDGSVAENALKHGCGAINIDATRVGSEQRTYSSWSNSEESSSCYSYANAKKVPTFAISVEGRWPANFILTHLDGCELRGTKKVKGAISKPSVGNDAKTSISMNNSKEGIHRVHHADEYGNEEVEDWACAEGCPVQELDRQSGVSKSTGGRIGNKGGAYSHLGETGIKDNAVKGDPGFGDEGGASRFFMQFKKDPEE